MEDTKFHHLRFLSGKMWFIFGTNCLFDGITIFKFEAKLCFWAQNVEVCWCSVCFYFVCFRFGGRFVIYIFFPHRGCMFVVARVLIHVLIAFVIYLLFIWFDACIYLFVCITQKFFTSSIFFFTLFIIPLSITLSIAFSFIRRNLRTPTESLFIFYSLISCHSLVTSFFSWLCHNLCWIFLFSSLCRSIYIFLIVIFRQMTTGCVLCWLKIVEFN